MSLYALLFLILAVPAACDEYIPPNIGELADDYYDVSGEPNLSAASVWESEFDSGESSALSIRIINRGNISVFEADELPQGSDEFRDADIESKLESDVTTAVNIHGVLENNQGAPVRITSGIQEIGYLREGEVSNPAEFEIEVFNNSPSGNYELSLNLTYQYQMEVQVEGYPEPEFNYWYVEKQQILPINITVKPEVDFKVESTRAQKVSDQEYMLYVRYRNKGSEVAENAVARIIVESPSIFENDIFKDDTAYLGNLSPGDSTESKYLIEVEEGAPVKTYGIETEVEYRDSHGEKRTSAPMRAPFRMEEALYREKGKGIGTVGYSGLLIGILALAGYHVYKKRRQRKKRRAIIFMLFLLLPLTHLVLAASEVHDPAESVPSNKWKFTEDYFTIYARPEIVVSLTDDAEYKRDDSDTILIQVMNQGKVLGFESEHEPGDENEIELSKIEKEMEFGATTAQGVMAYLRAKDAPLDIKTPAQSAGNLVSGQVSESLQFEIKVWKNASEGTYPLQVELSYQYQKDVYVEGDASNNMIDSELLYQEVNETHEVFVVIKKEANFEVINVESELYPGNAGTVRMTFKNTGEETASRAMARLRLSNPLSSTDYTAFLEDVEPEEEVRAVFNIDVDSDATIKSYPIKAEVEYEDVEGETRVSDTIYVPAEVKEAREEKGTLRYFLLLGAGIALAAVAYYYLKRRRKEGKIREGGTEEDTGEETEEGTGEETGEGMGEDGSEWS